MFVKVESYITEPTLDTGAICDKLCELIDLVHYDSLLHHLHELSHEPSFSNGLGLLQL